MSSGWANDDSYGAVCVVSAAAAQFVGYSVERGARGGRLCESPTYSSVHDFQWLAEVR